MAGDRKLGGFEPFNESHAIVMASITVQFSNQLDDTAWQNARSAILQTAKDVGLGKPQPFYGMNLTFDQSRVSISVNAPAPAVAEIAGLSFTQIGDDDQIIDRFVAAKDCLIIQTGSYVRWNSFISRAEKFVRGIWDAYSSNIPAAAVRCEYWDRFDHKDDEDHSVASLLRADGDFISRAAVRDEYAWNSHCGFYRNLPNGAPRLTSARVDCADFPGRDGQVKRSVLIHTMMQDGLPPVAEASEEVASFQLDDVLATLDSQHLELKDLLSRIITEEAVNRISLQG
ncbi:hypothetical protein [Aureimonas sp. ME7]|uniref:hypothetical protein n=1 Tax=Aureimonas sp. ME7 TaxID=2744252 RepID=UPI0015FC19F5|nr:hypothetical protein [Aureimonas sp. ME7]